MGVEEEIEEDQELEHNQERNRMAKTARSKSMSFSVFISHNRANLSTRYPFLTQDQIISRLRQQWRKLSDTAQNSNTLRSNENYYRTLTNESQQLLQSRPHSRNSRTDDNSGITDSFAYAKRNEFSCESHFQDEETEIDSPFMFVNDALRKLNNLSNWSKPQSTVSLKGKSTTETSLNYLKDDTTDEVQKLERCSKRKFLQDNVTNKHLKEKFQSHANYFDTRKERKHAKNHKIKTTHSPRTQAGKHCRPTLSSKSGIRNKKSQCATQDFADVAKVKSDKCFSKQPKLQKDGTPVRCSKRLSNRYFGDLHNLQINGSIEKEKEQQKSEKKFCRNQDSHQHMIKRAAKKEYEFLVEPKCTGKTRIEPKKIPRFSRIALYKEKKLTDVAVARLPLESSALPKKTMSRPITQILYDNRDMDASVADESDEEMFEEKNHYKNCKMFGSQEDPETQAALPKVYMKSKITETSPDNNAQAYDHQASQDTIFSEIQETNLENSVFHKPLGLLFQDPHMDADACAKTPVNRRLVTSAPAATPSNFGSMFDNDALDIFF